MSCYDRILPFLGFKRFGPTAQKRRTVPRRIGQKPVPSAVCRRRNPTEHRVHLRSLGIRTRSRRRGIRR